jgi:hypothetical protein
MLFEEVLDFILIGYLLHSASASTVITEVTSTSRAFNNLTVLLVAAS